MEKKPKKNKKKNAIKHKDWDMTTIKRIVQLTHHSFSISHKNYGQYIIRKEFSKAINVGDTRDRKGNKSLGEDLTCIFYFLAKYWEIFL